MRILIVKTSSLGDVIHNLPAISDIKRHLPDARIDWCVEEDFAAIPLLHPGVDRVICVAIRRWRKNPFRGASWRELAEARTALRAKIYDAVIDTQGLLKSALIASQARGPHCGYDAGSGREPVAARFYDRQFSVSLAEHAVNRNRLLAGAALGYAVSGQPDYGIVAPVERFAWLPAARHIVLLTATSRADKLWPEAHWLELGRNLRERGYTLVLPSGSALERERAARLAEGIPGALAVPPMGIPQLAALLAGASAVVGVDTGLTHLAVALKIPTVALYTATDPGLTGVLGAGFFRNLGGRGQLPGPAAVLAELTGVLE